MLSVIADQRTPTGDSIDIAFTIADENPSGVTEETASDDQTLVADMAIEILGSDAARTLRITPTPLGTGSAVITVTAKDQTGSRIRRAFAWM